MASISLHYASVAPFKAFFYVVLGLARTGTEVAAITKFAQAALKRDTDIMGRTLLCCYFLPVFMTLQALTVLFWMCLLLPGFLVNLCIIAFCCWMPPGMAVRPGG